MSMDLLYFVFTKFLPYIHLFWSKRDPAIKSSSNFEVKDYKNWKIFSLPYSDTYPEIS